MHEDPPESRREAPAGIDIQGHRGARGLLPENSIPGFQRALELGVTTLEMDVVVSRDRQVVVSHDPVFSPDICVQPDGSRIPVDRLSEFAIYQMDYETVKAFDCGSIGNPNFPSQRAMPASKPLLRDVIALSERYTSENGRAPVRYNIETKSRPDGDGSLHPSPDEFVALLLGVIGDAGVAERVIVQSFDPRTLRVARETDPAIRLSLLISRKGPGVDELVDWLGFTPEIASPDYRLVVHDYVVRLHDKEMQIIPWTINDPDDMKRLVDLGVDGLITDYPDVAIALFGR